jgi:hypothetical protein
MSSKSCFFSAEIIRVLRKSSLRQDISQVQQLNAQASRPGSHHPPAGTAVFIDALGKDYRYKPVLFRRLQKRWNGLKQRF